MVEVNRKERREERRPVKELVLNRLDVSGDGTRYLA
jgi:hypothetical protein